MRHRESASVELLHRRAMGFPRALDYVVRYFCARNIHDIVSSSQSMWCGSRHTDVPVTTSHSYTFGCTGLSEWLIMHEPKRAAEIVRQLTVRTAATASGVMTFIGSLLERYVLAPVVAIKRRLLIALYIAQNLINAHVTQARHTEKRSSTKACMCYGDNDFFRNSVELYSILLSFQHSPRTMQPKTNTPSSPSSSTSHSNPIMMCVLAYTILLAISNSTHMKPQPSRTHTPHNTHANASIHGIHA